MRSALSNRTPRMADIPHIIVEHGETTHTGEGADVSEGDISRETIPTSDIESSPEVPIENKTNTQNIEKLT